MTQTVNHQSLRPADPQDNTQGNLARQPGDGASNWEDTQRDTYESQYPYYFLDETERTDEHRECDSPFNPPRTSFDPKDVIKTYPDPNKFERLNRLNQDNGADYTGKARQKERLRMSDYYQDGDVILQALEVPEGVREWAIQKAIRGNIMGFNGDYNGYYGAYLGFALLALSEDLEDALQSKWFNRIETLVDERPDEHVNLDPEELADYVFRTYAPRKGEE